MKRQEDKNRKGHNVAVGAKIQKLKKEKEDLQLESYAKASALSNPRIYRDETTVAEYGRRLKEIERICAQIDKEVKDLERQIL